jgi:hypothetical protein
VIRVQYLLKKLSTDLIWLLTGQLHGIGLCGVEYGVDLYGDASHGYDLQPIHHWQTLVQNGYISCFHSRPILHVNSHAVDVSEDVVI